MTGGEWTVAKSRHRTKGSSEWSGGTPMRFQYYNTVGDLDAAVNASRQRTVLRSLTETITQAARNRFPDAVDISVIGVGIGSLCRNKASIEQWALFAHVCDALAREYKQVNRVISEPDLSELDISFMQSRSTRIVQPTRIITDSQTNYPDASSLLSQFSGDSSDSGSDHGASGDNAVSDNAASGRSCRARSHFLVFGFHCPPSLSCALSSLVSDTCLVISNKMESYITRMGTDSAIKDKAQCILNGPRFREYPLLSRMSSHKDDRPCEEAVNNMAIQTLI